jgi:hypothetical protein
MIGRPVISACVGGEQKRQATQTQSATSHPPLLDFAGDAPYPSVLVGDEEFYEQ